jgi:NAD-dependent DNA ligase
MDMDCSTEEIVRRLTLASEAYYNGDEILMSDEMYDMLREEIERREPHHPFLQKIGAPEKNASPLPYTMPSLRKIKPGKGDVGRFASRGSSWILSEKLDGISALWDGNKQLWLRGDGKSGPLISHIVPYIPSLLSSPFVIRGELLVANSELGQDVLPRSWVNGLVHKQKPNTDDLAKLRFLAYEIMSPCPWTREQQMTWLTQQGFQTPWYSVTHTLNDKILSEIFQERRRKSQYSLDGIVVGENIRPLRQETKLDTALPKDVVAFKMSFQDQMAETRVVSVEWNLSHQGYFIPKVQVEPVLLQGSKIQYLTGHNARCILNLSIGKGAKITIRKGGDVIPTLDSVIEPADLIVFPPEGTWEWVGDPDSATHIRSKGDTPEILTAKLVHFAKTLGLPWMAAGNIRKVVESGKQSVHDWVSMTEEDWKRILGNTLGSKIFESVKQIGKSGRTELELMIASSCLPRGVGESKLLRLFEQEPNPCHWYSKFQGASLPGWSSEGLQEFLETIPLYETWRKRELPGIPYPLIKDTGVATRLHACFTGFRSPELELACKKNGIHIQESVNSKTNVLVVKDSSSLSKPSEKVKKAQETCIRVLTRELFEKEYLS